MQVIDTVPQVYFTEVLIFRLSVYKNEKKNVDTE